MDKILTLIFAFIFTFTMLGQDPKLVSFNMASNNDLTARVNSRITQDGKYCALIKMSINDPNVKVNGLTEGNVTFTDNIYDIYLHPDATSLTIEAPGYNKLFIDLTQYETIYPLVEKQCYNLKISLPVLFSVESDTVNYEKAKASTENIECLVHLLKIKNKTPEIIRMMADCYLWSSSDEGVLNNYERYSTLYRQAAELGDDVGCQHVADNYEIDKDWENAIIWYERGASKGNAYCMYHLGDLYGGRDDYGQTVNESVAFKWYLSAAETSSNSSHSDSRTYAQCEVAECYYYGVGVQQDYDKAFFWYNKASEPFMEEHRFGRALFFVGQCHEFGRGTETNLQKAFECYLEAEKEGEERLACYRIGLWYLEGIHVDQNIPKALEYLNKAAESNSFSANLLGVIYLNGFYGLERDEKKAYDYFYKSFIKSSHYNNYHRDNCCAESVYNLGLCYEHGYGCDKNIKTAISYYSIAQDMGVKGASDAIARLESLKE